MLLGYVISYKTSTPPFSFRHTCPPYCVFLFNVSYSQYLERIRIMWQQIKVRHFKCTDTDSAVFKTERLQIYTLRYFELRRRREKKRKPGCCSPIDVLVTFSLEICIWHVHLTGSLMPPQTPAKSVALSIGEIYFAKVPAHCCAVRLSRPLRQVWPGYWVSRTNFLFANINFILLMQFLAAVHALIVLPGAIFAHTYARCTRRDNSISYLFVRLLAFLSV